jgi:hypothetical protein
MIRLGRTRVSLEGLLILTALFVLVVNGWRYVRHRDAMRDAAVVAAKAEAKHAIVSRDSAIAVTDSVTQQADSLASSVRILRQHLDLERKRLTVVLDSATGVLADSAATVPELRLALRETIESARGFAMSASTYQDSITVLLAVHQSERAAWFAERAANERVIAAQKAVIAGLEAQQCRVLWVRCPSRTASAIGGGVVALAAVVVLR